MSYLVLARKWRPRRFAELVGQEHVVRALTNALETGRVHHAFLFTGTRGVGKTTIARIFAKSLNCESGTSAEPCGTCEVCQAIDAGRFIDLLEIDAASNTGVDDVRELIENAQYMPSRGRTKVYLIDEVHMLSKAAFNALLKTLEEPPEHVKFLLATTDPQKLPVTVLSRCLQFNLKRLDEAQIGGQMRRILDAETIEADEGAIRQLAHAADGSLRDGLSLLDQAIAYAGGRLDDATVAAMLGSVDRGRIGQLLDALAAGDGETLLREVAELAEFSPDWQAVLAAIAEALHQVQVRQLVPNAAHAGEQVDIDGLATRLRPEVVQLWYQMALHGGRDLPLAPSPRAGFEMAVLRMLAFRPLSDAEGVESAPVRAQAPRASGAEAARAALQADRQREAGPSRPAAPARAIASPAAPGPVQPPAAAAATQSPPPAAAARAAPATTTAAAMARPDDATALDADSWPDLVETLPLAGPVRQLAMHAGFLRLADGVLQLSLSPADEHLKAPALVTLLAEALGPRLGGVPAIRFDLSGEQAQGETLQQRSERQRGARQAAAEDAFHNDPQVQRLVQRGARIVPDSIRPIDE